LRPAGALLALGLLALVLQGALATGLPAWALPDLAVLLPAALALVLGPAEGLLIAALLGLGADMLSGSLLGQQALARLLEFALTRRVAAQLDLRRAMPFAVFALALEGLDAALQLGLAQAFLGGFALHPADLAEVLGRAGVSAALAPLVGAGVRRIAQAFDDAEARREMRLDTRRPLL